MKGTSSTPIPDLVTDSYPLDNSTTTDLLEHQRPRTDSALFNQFVRSQNPVTSLSNGSSTAVRRNNADQPWQQVNGDWRHLQYPMNHPMNSNNDSGNHGDVLWFDSDQMDVPLLNTGMVYLILNLKKNQQH